jgi:hypothetical protein
MSRVHRVWFDFAVQTLNLYRFNPAVVDRPVRDDLALPLLKSRQQAESNKRFSLRRFAGRNTHRR